MDTTGKTCEVCGAATLENHFCECGNDCSGIISRHENKLAAALLKLEHAKLEVKEEKNNISHLKKNVAELRFNYRMLNQEPIKSRT